MYMYIYNNYNCITASYHLQESGDIFDIYLLKGYEFYKSVTMGTFNSGVDDQL